MKIALLYSGNFRTFNDCTQNHLEFFGDVFDNIDVYFSTWSEIKYTPWLNDPVHSYSNDRILETTKVNEDLIKNYIPKKWNLVSVDIQDYNSVDHLKFDESDKSLILQYYKIKKCFDLVPKKNDYDLLIRMRPDIKIGNKLGFDLLSHLVESKKILFNTNVWFDYPFQKKNSNINEMIWISNYDLMEKSSRIYDNFQTIKNTLGKNMYGESCCYQNLLLENIVDHLEFFNFEYTVIR